MGARPSTFKKGGGFLDGVVALFKDYQWTDEFNGEEFKPGKIKGQDGKPMEKPHSLNCFLTFRVDGAEEDTTTTIKAASDFELFEVSEDGHTLTLADGGPCDLSINSATAKFFKSLVEAGFPETNFSEDPDSIDFSPALGCRLQLQQRVDVERTKKYGQKEGKDGKKYDRKDLVVAEVLGLPEQESKSGKKGAKADVKGKGKPAKDENDEVDIDDLAKETLTAILKGEKSEEILKNKLSVKVLTKLSKHPQREDVRKRIFDDEFLELEDGWTYKKAKGLIILDE